MHSKDAPPVLPLKRGCLLPVSPVLFVTTTSLPEDLGVNETERSRSCSKCFKQEWGTESSICANQNRGGTTGSEVR